jgi:aspartyl/asparaginyl beta-hydroxylase (cupin superfamily)
VSEVTASSLVSEVQHLLGRGLIDQALALLRARQAAGSKDPEIPLHIALALRMQGNLAGALAAVDDALAIEPYHLLALLSKGGVLELMGQHRAAARVYRNALKIAPPVERLAPSLKGAVERARKAVAANTDALARHLREAVAPLRAQFEARDLGRFDECLEIFAGLKKRYVHEPLLLDFPQLPAITFYDRAHFPWLPKLEAATDGIRDEALALIKEDWDKFHPYIQLPAHAPANQWAMLNHSPSWSTLQLWRDGTRVDDVCTRCPRTVAALESVPLADQAGFAPTVMFSVLAPQTTIPPHTGSTNVRLIAHLPLVLPGQCRFRVGNDTREWKLGEGWVFDDTIEHEAWNDSDQIRIILIFDVWNPLVTGAERKLLTAMMQASNAYNAAT